ncbi:MAG: hypothetical protein IJN15_03260 [Clostridia bacterium]|nr:hypothetical protein [Clostridia bacterium]
MCLDNDMKIVGDKPSRDVKLNRALAAGDLQIDKEQVNMAKKIGEAVAEEFSAAVDSYVQGDEKDFELQIQRRLLLSFTATVGFEEYLPDALAGMAQKSFLDKLKEISAELYATSSDTGAFSFYYLAYRRGLDIERRIGQTFAMLCSHDGDPIFQELGEALYCWFLSVVKKTVEKYK